MKPAMLARAPLTPYLVNVRRWIWLGIAGGPLLFMFIVMLIATMNPETPANQLVDWQNAWVFLLPAAMVAYGSYVSMRWWRCPHCGLGLPTKYAVAAQCQRCGRALRSPR
jgi:hypothetical protein